MTALLQSLANWFGAHHVAQADAHERDRARQRIGISAFMLLAAAVGAWLTPGLGLHGPVALASALYAGLTLLYLKAVLARRGSSPGWQYTFIMLDSVFTVVCMVGAPLVMAPLYPVLMVLVVRCGMRYGMRTLWLAWGAGALAAAVLMPLSNYWRGEPQLLRSFVVMMLITPLLFGPLIRRLHQATDELRTAAGSDPLTGLGNRRMLAEHLCQAQQRCGRDGTAMALLALDLDNFKLVNDSLGHSAGDWLLQAVAHAIRDNTRAGDFVARVGGDEFVLLVEGLSRGRAEQQAQAIATKMVQVVQEAAAAVAPGAGVSASAGVQLWAGEVLAADTGQQLLDGADRAMYQAKRAGKARVCLAPAA